MSPAYQRALLGRLFAASGALLLAGPAMALLSAAGPSALALSPRAWSLFYFGHFVALVAAGYGCLALEAARSKVFHGGPTLDFTIGLGAFVLASSLGRGWIPGLFLVAFGLRLMNGRPLLGR